MWNSCTSVIPNTRAKEQQGWNKSEKQIKKGKQRGENMELVAEAYQTQINPLPPGGEASKLMVKEILSFR